MACECLLIKMASDCIEVGNYSEYMGGEKWVCSREDRSCSVWASALITWAQPWGLPGGRRNAGWLRKNPALVKVSGPFQTFKRLFLVPRLLMTSPEVSAFCQTCYPQLSSVLSRGTGNSMHDAPFGQGLFITALCKT